MFYYVENVYYVEFNMQRGIKMFRGDLMTRAILLEKKDKKIQYIGSFGEIIYNPKPKHKKKMMCPESGGFYLSFRIEGIFCFSYIDNLIQHQVRSRAGIRLESSDTRVLPQRS